MNNNIGKKVKILAIVFDIVALLAGVVLWAVFMFNMDGEHLNYSDDYIAWIGLALAVITCVYALPLYAFGRLVENSDIIRNYLKLINDQISNSQKLNATATEANEPTNIPAASKTTYKAPSAGTSIHNAVPARDYVPAWKRVQMQNESKNDSDN